MEKKSCPFCDSTNLDISEKGNKKCVYCKDCNTYGPRVLVYSLPENWSSFMPNCHYFKNIKDLHNNSSDDNYHPIFEKHDDSEVPYEWYTEEAIRRWNERK